MDDNNKFRELLTAYLLGEANEEDEQLVQEWMAADQGNKHYFEELRHILLLIRASHATQDIVLDDEWMKFKERRPDNETTVVEKELIYEKPFRIRTLYNIIIATAIAASIMLVIGLKWGTFNAERPIPKTMTSTGKQKDDTALKVASLMRRERNSSGKTQRLDLSDGSVILLADGSEVSFPEPFTGNKRDIILKGRAEFIVAKDKSKPFTVYSGVLATTALGTRFTVEAFEHTPTIIVKLYEGKVMIRPADGKLSALKDIVYLLPGQQLTYDPGRSVARLEKIPVYPIYDNFDSAERADVSEGSYDHPSIPKNREGTWYMFNNQSLGKVFEQLEDMYNVKIIYSKKDVAKMYFIGTFNKSDSVENVLHQIAALNNLKVRKEDSAFIISK